MAHENPDKYDNYAPPVNYHISKKTAKKFLFHTSSPRVLDLISFGLCPVIFLNKILK